ncbi:MAG: hypothetical protein HPY82_05590 [Gammaproteobacteria bacterium]|nr:hypothetical protein [Gammaproteobacteria bacterium]
MEWIESRISKKTVCWNWMQFETFQHQSWLLVASGLLTWAVVSAGILHIVWVKSVQYSAGATSGIVLLLLLFGGVFLYSAFLCLKLVMQHLANGTAMRLSRWWLLGLAQYCLVIAIAYLFTSITNDADLVCILLLLVTPQLAIFVGAWVTFIALALASIPLSLFAAAESELVLYLSYITLHAILIGFTHCILSEQRAKEQLIATNKRLLDAQIQLANNAKQDERLRIARDLHDRVGHHLTALSIQLEVSRMLANAEVLVEIQKAQQITKCLLKDVREAVGEFRDQQHGSLDQHIQQLTDNLQQIVPQVTFQYTNLLSQEFCSTAIVDVLQKAVQELLTNALKHGSPTLVQINVDRVESDIRLQVSDNGQSSQKVAAASYSYVRGNGLAGIYERVADIRGSFWAALDQQGFSATITVPCDGTVLQEGA